MKKYNIRIKAKNYILQTIKRMQINCTGHIWSTNNSLKQLNKVKMEERRNVMRRGETSRKQLFDDIKNKRV
jgi:hypothetical protein